MPKQISLVMCGKCYKHGNWRFQDGSTSDQFITQGEGALFFLKAIREGKASLLDVDTVLFQLEKTQLMVSKIELVAAVIAENTSPFSLESSAIPNGCDPRMN